MTMHPVLMYHKCTVTSSLVQLTGRHIVRDVSCKNCNTRLGWIYVSHSQLICSFYYFKHRKTDMLVVTVGIDDPYQMVCVCVKVD